MKLYATTTSERGKESKKGANKYMNIEITLNRDTIYYISFEVVENGVEVYQNGHQIDFIKG